MLELPEPLRGRPFTIAEAERHGLTRRQLRHRRFSALFRGVYVPADLDLTADVWAQAAVLAGPPDAVASHLTALRHHGYGIKGDGFLHLSTRLNAVCRDERIRVHRRIHPIASEVVRGLRVTSPARTFVDCALKLPPIQAVMVGDWFVHRGLVAVEDLVSYCAGRHLDGVVAARQAAQWVAERAESPFETLVRMVLVTAGLPAPECNIEIHDEFGAVVQRVDLAFVDWRVIVEYDGAWHQTDRRQRRKDRDHRDELARLGWTVIVVQRRDLDDPVSVVRRVHRALADHGYREPLDFLGSDWRDHVRAALALT